MKRSVPNIDTKLIQNFQSNQSFVLEEGDFLYLPPRIPHNGISLDNNCITISFGLRSPSYQSMMTAMTSYVNDNMISIDDYYIY